MKTVVYGLWILFSLVHGLWHNIIVYSLQDSAIVVMIHSVIGRAIIVDPPKPCWLLLVTIKTEFLNQKVNYKVQNKRFNTQL